MNQDQASYIITHAGYFDEEEVQEAMDWERDND